MAEGYSLDETHRAFEEQVHSPEVQASSPVAQAPAVKTRHFPDLNVQYTGASASISPNRGFRAKIRGFYKPKATEISPDAVREEELTGLMDTIGQNGFYSLEVRDFLRRHDAREAGQLLYGAQTALTLEFANPEHYAADARAVKYVSALIGLNADMSDVYDIAQDLESGRVMPGLRLRDAETSRHFKNVEESGRIGDSAPENGLATMAQYWNEHFVADSRTGDALRCSPQQVGGDKRLENLLYASGGRTMLDGRFADMSRVDASIGDKFENGYVATKQDHEDVSISTPERR